MGGQKIYLQNLFTMMELFGMTRITNVEAMTVSKVSFLLYGKCTSPPTTPSFR